MKYVKNYECTLCHKTFDKNVSIYTCDECGEKGILDINYESALMKEVISKEYFKNNTDYTMWRYKHLMSVKDIDYSNTLKVGWTPHYESLTLKEELGLNKFFIKDEGLNPTASLKDRASAVAVVKAMEENAEVISCSSTGNAASSLAGNAARMGLKTVIFVPLVSSTLIFPLTSNTSSGLAVPIPTLPDPPPLRMIGDVSDPPPLICVLSSALIQNLPVSVSPLFQIVIPPAIVLTL